MGRQNDERRCFPISFWCHEVPYLENGAFIETIVGKSTNGFLRSSSQNAFQPMFNIGRDRGEGKAYEAIFLGDTLISPDTGPALGTFYEDAIMLLGAGGINENPGYYTTGTLCPEHPEERDDGENRL